MPSNEACILVAYSSQTDMFLISVHMMSVHLIDGALVQNIRRLVICALNKIAIFEAQACNICIYM